jgi:tight adherence protein C
LATFIASNLFVRSLVLVALFGLVVALVFFAVTSYFRRSATRSELRAISSGATEISVESLTQRRDDTWMRLVDRLEKAGLNLTDTNSDALLEKMRAAGFESPAAPRIYTLIRLVLVIALPTLFVVLSLAMGKEVSFFQLYLFGSIAALFGLFAPALFVSAKADRRREAITRGFPDCLDLLLVCVEAGLSFESGLDRVGKELTISHPLVARLLTITTLRMRAGENREGALRHMAETAGVDEISSFATLMIQSDKLGTSIAQTLRIYAAEMREKRVMRAEEKAHRLPVLISIPLVTCMLPVMIGVLMLPAIILVIRQLVPAMSGG